MLRLVAALVVTIAFAGCVVIFSGSAALAAQVKFTEEFMTSSDNIAVGKNIFKKHCSRCHGRKAYPGKAPKLKPEKYTRSFVFNRITKGFRGMPSWKRLYDEHQRKSLTAYIMSKGFKN